jgi:hypothetical protein
MYHRSSISVSNHEMSPFENIAVSSNRFMFIPVHARPPHFFVDPMLFEVYLYNSMFAMATFIQAIIILLLTLPTSSFILRNVAHEQRYNSSKRFSIKQVTNDVPMNLGKSRRDVISATLLNIGITFTTSPVCAASRESLADLLYRIIRVREATVMETRLIKTGSFKDAQRANIKLAVRFMVENYRLNDAFVAASTYLDGGNRRLEASQLGQSATQNLVTILEYFDAADVQNLKVIRGFC